MKNESYYSSDEYFQKLNKYWSACNYLAVAQLYLLDNPLMRDHELCSADIKKKLVGHWGTVPGQNFIYAHCDRIIKKYNQNMLLLSGPGHGGNFFTANNYLEGTYSEYYPEISQDYEGMKRFCKQFSFPGGIGSHCVPEIPGSIHEGGELGYVLAHAYGAVFDNPDLIAVAIIGDGEAETGPLATSWHSNKFINPTKDGAVLPILHLNGYKINNPTFLSRINEMQLESLLVGYGYNPKFVTLEKDDDVLAMHKKMAEAMDSCIEEIKQYQDFSKAYKELEDTTPIYDDKELNELGEEDRELLIKIRNKKAMFDKFDFTWPMIVLRTPKGWTGPKEVNGKQIEGSFRAHQIPLDMSKSEHLNMLRDWLKSYKPDELFTRNYRLKKEIADILPKGNKRLGATPYANGGRLLKELITPNIDNYEVNFSGHGTVRAQDMNELSGYVRDLFTLNRLNNNYRIFSPDEAMSNRLYKVFEVENRDFNTKILPSDERLRKDGRIMDSFLSEHVCEGWLEGYLLTGRHGMFNSYEAFVRVVDSMVAQHAKWLKVCNEIPWRAPISSLNLILTSNVWQQDHNGFTHQDPGFLDHIVNKKADVVRVYLPPDANCLISCYDHCAKSKNYVNVIIASKHPSYQWLNMKEAKIHCQKGVSVWQWAGMNDIKNPDLVVACCGSTPTIESLAMVTILKEELPNLNVRFVNVVDLMKLVSNSAHPHGLTDVEYDKIFTADKPIIFNFHGYPQLIHQLTYNRHNQNLHVSGYNEEGTITTPFDMRVKNKIDRYHLVIKALKFLDIPQKQKTRIKTKMEQKLSSHDSYIREYGVDMPEIENWYWNDKK